ncbi:MAG: GspE/PulE family protein [bacterium]
MPKKTADDKVAVDPKTAGGPYLKPSDAERQYFEKMAGKHYAPPSSGKANQLGKILEEAGLVNQEMILEAIRDSGETATTLKQNLIQTGLVREDEILDAIAQQMGMKRVDINQVQITPELIEQLDPKLIKKYRVFPVAYDDNSITIALHDPTNINVTDDLERLLGKQIIGCIASEEDIDRAIKRYYEGSEVEELYEALTEDQGDDTGGFKSYEEVELSESEIEQPPVVKFVDLIFKQAVHDRASDIHIEPARTGVTVRFRIDGVLQEVPSPPKKWQNAILSRLKVLAGMDLAEKRVPQDGRIKLNLPDKKLDLRVSSLPAIFGESIVMRILDQSSVMMGLADVGFLPDNVEIFERLIKTPNGIILMTGPTGSGKTTTLYAALSTLNNAETKIITIENPVEYQIQGINQVQVNEEIGMDFAAGLRAMLRQSPDVIMVGEIRDHDTAEIAIRAALTGHLVFSTLHTNDAPSATIRLIDMGMKPFLVASSIQAVIAQRLVRKICAHCKEAFLPPEEVYRELGVDPNDYIGVEIYRGRGCERCNESGYRGRTAIHEIFILTAKARQLVIRSESAVKLKKEAIFNGMRTLRMDGWQKVLLGQTTIEEVMRITQGDSS